MQKKRAVVFANGEYSDSNRLRANVCTNDYLVCVDGGARHCLNSGFTPDLLVGDLDSLDDELSTKLKASGTDCIRYPSEKDASDLELAFAALIERSVDEVVLLGISGGRTDHHLFNWQLAGSRSWPFTLRIIDDSVDAQLVDSHRPFSSAVPEGLTFSVIPTTAAATGVQISGAKYSLNGATLKLGSTTGLSNVTNALHLQVTVEEGIVLVMSVIQEPQ